MRRAAILLSLVAAACTSIEFKPRTPRSLDWGVARVGAEPSAMPLVSSMPSAGTTTWPSAPTPTEARLSNGVRVLLLEQHTIPLAAFALVVQRGSIDAPPGVFSLFLDTLTSGSDELTPKAIQHGYYEFAVEHSIRVEKGWSAVSAQFVAPLLHQVIGMIAPSFSSPTFDGDTFDELLAAHRRAAAIQRGGPAAEAQREVYRMLYPPTHPYWSSESDGYDAKQALASIDLGAIRALRPLVAADDVAIVAAGDVTMPKLVPLFEKALRALPRTSSPRKTYDDAPPPPPPAHVLAVDRPGDVQVQVAVGFEGVKYDDPAFPALFALAKFAADSAHATLRLGHGLTYSVSSGLAMTRLPSPVVISAAVDPHRVGQAVRDVFASVDRLAQLLKDPAELDRLRTWLLGRWPAPYDTVDQSISYLEVLAGLGLPADTWTKLRTAVEHLSADDLIRVGRRYLDRSHAQVVLIGDVSEFRADLGTLGIEAVDVRNAGL